jgi:hypothetical protein
VRRLHQGRATALVPLDAVGPATLEPITPATIPVVLMVGGADVERFEFALDNPPEVRGDEPQQLADAMATLVAVTEQAEQVIAGTFERFGQTTTDRAMLQSYFRFALGNFRDASQQMTALVATLSPEEARKLGYFFQVGGLRELDAAARAARLAMASRAAALSAGLSTGPSAGPASGVDLLNLLCATNDATELAGRVDTVLSTACGIAAISAALSGFFNGPIGPAVAAGLITICNGVSFASDTLTVITDILPKAGSTLSITAERVSAAPPTFHIRVMAPLERNLLCGAGSGASGFLMNRVRDLIVRRLSQRLTAWLSFGFIRNFPFESRDGSLRRRIVDFMVGQIQSLAGVVVTAAGLQEWIDRKKDELCGRFSNGAVAIPIDQLTLLQHDPVGDGTLTRPGAGSNEPAVFVCAAQSTGNRIVRIDAATVACGKTLAGSTTIDCRGVTVTFCQGDNGSALDDIFELVVNGEVLLAPSVPVRRVCGTRMLSPGDHEVLLRGRAAPDNIGTYFIEASPGRLIGPPLSGTDLTAGRVFRWTLRIDPPQQ